LDNLYFFKGFYLQIVIFRRSSDWICSKFIQVDRGNIEIRITTGARVLWLARAKDQGWGADVSVGTSAGAGVSVGCLGPGSVACCWGFFVLVGFGVGGEHW
jgi:hypothetical protein